MAAAGRPEVFTKKSPLSVDIVLKEAQLLPPPDLSLLMVYPSASSHSRGPRPAALLAVAERDLVAGRVGEAGDAEDDEVVEPSTMVDDVPASEKLLDENGINVAVVPAKSNTSETLLFRAGSAAPC